MKRIVYLIAFLAIASTDAFAQQILDKNLFKVPASGDDMLKVRVFSDMTSIEPDGTFRVAFYFDLNQPWYTYTAKDSDSHYPTAIEMLLPNGVVVESVKWPQSGDDEMLKDDFLVVYTLKANGQSSDFSIKGSITYQCCNGTICTMKDASFTVGISVGKKIKSTMFKLLKKR